LGKSAAREKKGSQGHQLIYGKGKRDWKGRRPGKQCHRERVVRGLYLFKESVAFWGEGGNRKKSPRVAGTMWGGL